MKLFFYTLFFLSLSACSQGGYEGKSAWSAYQERVSETKRPVENKDIDVGKISKAVSEYNSNPKIKQVSEETYFSAAGSKCKKVRNMVEGKVDGIVSCVYEDGKEVHYNDLTL